MYQLVILIQCISITVLFVESWVVFKKWTGMLQSYLFLSCIATLVSNIGYLLQLRATSEETYFTALRINYFGKLWMAFGLFFFAVELVQVEVPNIARAVLVIANFVIYISVLTTKYTGLYYTYMNFGMAGDFPVFSHKDGIFHHFWSGIFVFYVAAGMLMLMVERHREKNELVRKRLLFVILAVFTESIFGVVQTFKLVAVTKVYDITMLSFPIGALFMLIAIYRYKLFDTEALAREYVIDELSEGIIAVDQIGNVSYYNKPALMLFPEMLFKPEKVVNSIKRSIEAGAPININGRIYTPEANELHQAGLDAGIVYSLTDDTEHYRYMRELEEQKRIADNANKAKSSFLANMSHEIRTPINAVLGMDEMILRESKEKEVLGYARDIKTAGRTLLSLINDILDFSKIEEGKMEILPIQYEVSSVVNDLVNMTRDRASAKGLKFEVNVDKNIPHLLLGDEIRIKQVVLNLLTNAVKYTEKGKVGLNVGFNKKSDDEIGLTFKVTDTGIGIKEEDIQKLFSPFSRIEEKRNRTIEGTGLGMSIVKQLLSLMNSKLEVESVYGEGSEFSFEIAQKVIKWEPVGDVAARFDEEASKGKTYHELFRAPEAKILVVDDTEMNLTVIENLLKRTQIKIDKATSGRDALNLARDKKYDIIFIDHMMPDMDGIETLKHMKEETDEEGVYIALTANAVSGAREMYLEAGFVDYMSKPVDGERLEELLKFYLPKEKIEEVKENDDSLEETSDSKELLPDWLLSINEIDTDAAVKNCGSAESFISVLQVFHQTAKSKAKEIEDLFDNEDYENYTIKVHALKSSARIIGAADLSDKARKLEDAGKAGDIDTIKKDTKNLLDDYRAIDEKLSPIDKKSDNLKEMTPEIRNEAIRTIGEIADTMDFEMMEGMLKDLKEYRLSDEDEKAVNEIEDMLMQLNWEGISDAVRKLMA